MLWGSVSNAEITNNLFHDAQGSAIETYNFTGSDVVVSYNRQSTNDPDSGEAARMFLPTVPSGVTGSNNTDDSILGLVDADNRDFRLACESPAIDAGWDVGLPYSGDAPDQGYWEAGSCGDAPAPPSGLEVF
jgi:hypothetical protein